MKNIIRTFIVAVFAVAAASCGRSLDFEHQTFATFYSGSYSVAEDAGEISIPVQIYNPKGGEVSVTIEAVDGEGDSGALNHTDFRIVSPENGVLKFGGDVDSLDVVVAVTDYDGDKQGSKNFSLRISSKTDGVPTGALQTTKITIRDMDHPLAHFIGEWTGSTLGQVSSSEYTFNFTFDSVDGDESLLFLEFTDPIMSPTITYMTLKVNAINGPIVIPSMSYLGVMQDYQCYYSGLSTVSLDNTSSLTDLYMNYSASNNTLTIPNGFGVFLPVDGGYSYYEVYLGGMVLTKR